MVCANSPLRLLVAADRELCVECEDPRAAFTVPMQSVVERIREGVSKRRLPRQLVILLRRQTDVEGAGRDRDVERPPRIAAQEREKQSGAP